MAEPGRIFTAEEAPRTEGVVLHVEQNPAYIEAKRGKKDRRGLFCRYYWDFEIHGGLPTTGSQIWSVTLNSDTQDVTVDFDMTAAELTNHLLAQFSGLASTNISVTGGPLPEVPLTVQWKNAFANHASSDWPPTVGTNSLDNAGWMLVRQINPRG